MDCQRAQSRPLMSLNLAGLFIVRIFRDTPELNSFDTSGWKGTAVRIYDYWLT